MGRGAPGVPHATTLSLRYAASLRQRQPARRDSSSHRTRGPLRFRENPMPDPVPQRTGHSEEYLSVEQLSRRIPYRPKTIRNLMSQGTFIEGIHFTRLTGRPIFLWTRVEK